MLAGECRAILLLLAVSNAACVPAGVPDGRVRSIDIKTDRTSYELRRQTGFSALEGMVGVTVSNRGPSARFFRVCGGKVDGMRIVGRQPIRRIVAADTYEQVNGIGQEWACLGAPPRELEPGAEIRDSVLLLTASETWCARHAGQPLRIRYEIMDDPADDVNIESRLAIEEQVSNTFVIRCVL
jgi:hypothetical protein